MVNIPALVAFVLLSLAGGAPAVASDHSAQGSSTEALRIARESRKEWSLGKLTAREKRGKSLEVRANLLHRGVAVGKLRIDPGTGGFLAKGEKGAPPPDPLDLPRLRVQAENSLRLLDVGGWAWPTERGRAWGVPLQYQGRVVGKIAVDVRKGRLLVKGKDKKDDDD